MPITPLHMGPALVVKATARQHFSIPTFAVTQVAIDSEVIVGMAFVGDLSFHGVLHTLPGATAVAALTVLLSRRIISRMSRLWNYVSDSRAGSLTYMDPDVSRRIVALSAAFGAYSHVLLDSAANINVAPLIPLTDANPLYGLVLPEVVVLICIVGWTIGGGLMLGLSYLRRRRREGVLASADESARG